MEQIGSYLAMISLSAQGIPDPPQLISPMPSALWLALFGTTALIAVALATYWAVIRRDALPLVGCLGAFICALNEPIFDVLGKIVYAENNIIAFSALGRDIPLFLMIGYIAWVGLFPYVIAGWMHDGWSAKRLYTVSIVGVASVWGVEAVNLFIHGWSYYGQAPLKFFGGVAAMASVPLAAGFLVFSLALPATGWKRLVAGLFIPMFSLPMMFAATGWPLYLALNSDLPPIMDYVAIAAMCALIAVANIAIVKLTVVWRGFSSSNIQFDSPRASTAPSANEPASAACRSTAASERI